MSLPPEKIYEEINEASKMRNLQVASLKRVPSFLVGTTDGKNPAPLEVGIIFIPAIWPDF